MIDLSFLSQRMWDVYSLCSGVAKAGFNRMRDWENLSGVTFMDLMRNVDGTVKYAASNPKEQLMQDYYAWKAVQPQRYLPESKGDTEENRAFLRRNFSGQLSVMDRIYALDTMREMGMITEEEMRETIGVNEFNISIVSLKEIVPVMSEPAGLDPAISRWNEFFTHANISRCPTLDKLYEMTGKVRETFRQREAYKKEQQSAAAEVESALNLLTSRKVS